MARKGYHSITISESLHKKIKSKADKKNRSVPEQIEYDEDHCQEG